jgi:hypothetical protein
MGHFFGELRRRKVLRVAVAYIVTSWVLLQVADLLASILELPEWTARLAFVILVVGFVPALILAWAYELTPEGIRVTPNDAMQAPAGTGSRSKMPALAAGLIMLVLAAGGGIWYSGIDARWARNEGMPDVEALVADGDLEAAYELALRVEAAIPGDPDMAQIWDSFAWTTSIPSTPAGATVSRRAYSDSRGEWQSLGMTPIHDVRIPFGASLLRIELEGHLKLLRVLGGGLITTTDLPVQEEPRADFMTVNPERYVLDTEETTPGGMVRVPGKSLLLDGDLVEVEDFFLGKYEVTNEEFQGFVDAGGYGRRDLWEHQFVEDGESISFDEAMAMFIDSTGRPGPSSWEAGTYPGGEGDHPVAGVSWYEAAAYARYAGYELPSIHHWRRAFAVATLAWQLPASNLTGEGVAPVGKFVGIGWTGTYDMAGNVREWCFNAVGKQQRAIVGSAWDEHPYMVEESMTSPHNVSAFNRSPTNGFRLAATHDDPAVARRLRQVVAEPPMPQIRTPVSDDVFAASLSEYEYDRGPLRPVVEETEEFRHWTRLRLSIANSSGTDRIPIYLYLPHRESSRHQALLYWPGVSAMYTDSVDQHRLELGFALRNGRAVVYPILKGTYGRRSNARPDWSTHTGRNLAIEQVREFRRVIDYLETRPDIEHDNLAFFGRSWGGRLGAVILAVEPRLKVGILNQAGINFEVHPDIDVVHFLPRVTTPVLQFNGLYDTDFRYQTSAKPYFDLLGTAEPHKKHVVEPTGHFVPPSTVMGETLDWLDKYQGPLD